MSDEQVIRYCAPTLASIKTGSMFNASFSCQADMAAALLCLNQRLSGKGLRVLPLRWQGGHGLIYVYRPVQLAHDLCDDQARAILLDCGYCELLPERCVARLMKRLRSSGDFPHEVGLFLGYPPADVDGFIHRHDACLLIGAWKVYSNAASAQRSFDRISRCTSIYLQRYRHGVPLEQLTVSSHR